MQGLTQAIKVNSSHLLKPEILTEEDVTAELVFNENEIILKKVKRRTNGNKTVLFSGQ